MDGRTAEGERHGEKDRAQDVAALTLASSLIAQQPQNGKDARLFRVAIPDALAGRIDGKAPHQEGFRRERIEAGLQAKGRSGA